MLADYHVHTIFSDDSEYPMEEVVKDSIDLGLDEICFTDHVDYGVKRDVDDKRGVLLREGFDGVTLSNVDYPKYYQSYLELKEKYSNKINLKLGMEFGIQTHTIKDFEKLFVRYPFDFIILSIHQINDKEFWTQHYQRGLTQQQYNEGYYKELLNVVKNYHNYSVLGHLDLIVRYDKLGIYPFEKVKVFIEEVLKVVISDGKGIEVNTSCFRYGLNDLTPSIDILKLYKELGGSIITIGSDSHKKEHLGCKIKETQTQLKDLGFKYFCTYENMKEEDNKKKETIIDVIKNANEEAKKQVGQQEVNLDLLEIISVFSLLLKAKNVDDAIEVIPEKYKEVAGIYIKVFTKEFFEKEAVKIIKNAKNEKLRELDKNGEFSKEVVNVVNDISSAVYKYYKQEINEEQFIEALKESSIDKIAGKLFDVYFDAKLEDVINEICSSYTVYITSTIVYEILMKELDEAEMAHQHRLMVEKQCQLTIDMMIEYRTSLIKLVNDYFNENISVFENSFKAMDEAILSGDSNNYLKANSQIQKLLNYDIQFSTQEQFNDLMESNIDFKL